MIAISRTGRLLRRLVRVSCRRPYLTVGLSLALAVLGVAVTVHGLRFKTSGRDVLPQNAGYVQKYVEYARDFGELDDIMVVVEARTFEAAKAYAVRLVQELRASPVKFDRASLPRRPQALRGPPAPLPVQREAARDPAKIFDHQEFMESFAADPSLAQLITGVNIQFAQAFMNNVFDIGLEDKSPADTRFLQVLLEQIAQRLDRPTPYRSPWGSLFSFGRDADPDAGYFLSEDKSLLFVFVETPRARRAASWGTRPPSRPFATRWSGCGQVFPNVQAGVTGAPVLSNDEMTAAFEDSRVRDRARLRAHARAHAGSCSGAWVSPP